MDSSTYYMAQQHKLLRKLDSFAKLIRPELAVRYREQSAGAVHQATLAEYEKLIPSFPYIDGKANSLTSNLVRTKTLAWGCDGCDFRITKKWSWPPRFINYFNNIVSLYVKSTSASRISMPRFP